MQARIAALEATCTPVAERLPAYTLLRTIPGIGPTVGAILLAEIGDIAWFTQFSQLRKLAGLDIVRVQSGQYAGQARISKCGRSLLRWALDHAAMGMARTGAGPARRPEGEAPRQSLRRLQGDRRTCGESAPDRLGRVAERDPVRPAADGWAPAAAALSGGAPDWKTSSSPGSRQRDTTTWRPQWGPPGDTGAPLPLSSARTRPGGPLGAASRPDGTTTMRHGRSSRSGLGG